MCHSRQTMRYHEWLRQAQCMNSQMVNGTHVQRQFVLDRLCPQLCLQLLLSLMDAL